GRYPARSAASPALPSTHRASRRPLRLPVRGLRKRDRGTLGRIAAESMGGVVLPPRRGGRSRVGAIGWGVTLTPPRCLASLDTDPPLRGGKRSPGHGDVLRLHEFHQALVGTLSSDAALLHAAEGRGRIRHEAAVEPDHAVLEALRDPKAAADVAREEIR